MLEPRYKFLDEYQIIFSSVFFALNYPEMVCDTASSHPFSILGRTAPLLRQPTDKMDKHLTFPPQKRPLIDKSFWLSRAIRAKNHKASDGYPCKIC